MGRDIYSAYESTEIYLDLFLKSPKKVQQLLLMPLTIKTNYPRFWESDTIKSPIEQIFITAFDIYILLNNKENIYLIEQEEEKYKNKKYYIDFVFKADDYLSNLVLRDKIKNHKYKLAIECDGYEFHQKTKEQVEKDNEREFDLKMLGYDVLRFSGTQIYNNPLKCAEDTYNYIIIRIGE